MELINIFFLLNLFNELSRILATSKSIISLYCDRRLIIRAIENDKPNGIYLWELIVNLVTIEASPNISSDIQCPQVTAAISL